jgi:hypothetical protein
MEADKNDNKNATTAEVPDDPQEPKIPGVSNRETIEIATKTGLQPTDIADLENTGALSEKDISSAEKDDIGSSDV